MELTQPYWTILHRFGLIRTAEEEERRRFTAAPPVTAAELTPDFAKSVHHRLRACVRACPQTDGTPMEFVQAGQLHLQLFYCEDSDMFLVHNRWLTLPSAREELGLLDDSSVNDVVFHTVKRLFAEALEQLPRHIIDLNNDPGTAERRKKQEVSRTEQRLLNFSRTKLRIDHTSSTCKGPGLTFSWNLDANRARFDTPIEIQLHRSSRCSHLRDSLLTAEDGASLRHCQMNLAVSPPLRPLPSRQMLTHCLL